ncbi:MAG: hypothetical protein ACUVRV_01055 [Cyanobacteriota bacterium]
MVKSKQTGSLEGLGIQTHLTQTLYQAIDPPVLVPVPPGVAPVLLVLGLLKSRQKPVH